jgi:hypothetical protein
MDMKVAFVGDTHADPNHDKHLRRFTDMGEYLAPEDCDVVCQVGDWYDMPSITDHRGRLEGEGDRYNLDIEVGNQALNQFMRPFRKRKKRMPHFIFLVGNHEYRIERYVQQNPRMAGSIGLHDMDFDKWGWEVIPFGRFTNIGGFYATHHILGKAGRAVALAPTFTKRGVSMVVGHTHEAKHIKLPRQTGYTHGLDVGCMTRKGYAASEDWSAPNEHSTWRGLHIMDGVANGDYKEYREVAAEVFTSE